MVDSRGSNGGQRASGYELSRYNAAKHAILSRETVLPWEDRSRYEALLASLSEEHQPHGPTECHLVEEIADAIWRQGRRRRAEVAAHNQALMMAIESHQSAASAAIAHKGIALQDDGMDYELIFSDDKEKVKRSKKQLPLQLERVCTAIELLIDDDGNPREAEEVHEEAFEYLTNDIIERMNFRLTLDGRTLPDKAALMVGILQDEHGRLSALLLALSHQAAIRRQVLGEAMLPEGLDLLMRYETHLDRRLEKRLGMLLKLQELRRSSQKQ